MVHKLIVHHPKKPRLLVNFHMDLLQLMRETKYLQRLGIEVPQSAIDISIQVHSTGNVLLPRFPQEDILKEYFRRLTLSIKKYNRITLAIKPVANPLLKFHIEEMQNKLLPGMRDLNWKSLGILMFIQNLETGKDILILMGG